MITRMVLLKSTAILQNDGLYCNCDIFINKTLIYVQNSKVSLIKKVTAIEKIYKNLIVCKFTIVLGCPGFWKI